MNVSEPKRPDSSWFPGDSQGPGGGLACLCLLLPGSGAECLMVHSNHVLALFCREHVGKVKGASLNLG